MVKCQKVLNLKNLLLVCTVLIWYNTICNVNKSYTNVGPAPTASLQLHKKLLNSDLPSSQTDFKLQLKDLFMTVKTTHMNYETRIPLLLKTWCKAKVQEQVYFVTDKDDENLQKATGNHLVPTKCGETHGKPDLCCKTGVEFDIFYFKSTAKWWCHFDDDTYVNIDRLLEYLETLNWKKPHYTGGDHGSDHRFKTKFLGRLYYAGYLTGSVRCLSRSLAHLMQPFLGQGALVEFCEQTNKPDDILMGVLINGILNVTMTRSNLFHDHTFGQSFSDIKPEEWKSQISFSYSKYSNSNKGVNFGDGIEPAFDHREDKTRLLSIHCHLHPTDKICPK
ncbi:fringe glycosyltransferase-like [Clavelina lepadiformis]|uniref:Fringe-like glycosyltransferase domain-containing protein n=1 Tax=Clavelina lepadiformis TaxID=159417 RepID=A0ABP0GD18_CLALP